MLIAKVFRKTVFKKWTKDLVVMLMRRLLWKCLMVKIEGNRVISLREIRWRWKLKPMKRKMVEETVKASTQNTKEGINCTSAKFKNVERNLGRNTLWTLTQPMFTE